MSREIGSSTSGLAAPALVHLSNTELREVLDEGAGASTAPQKAAPQHSPRDTALYRNVIQSLMQPRGLFAALRNAEAIHEPGLRDRALAAVHNQALIQGDSFVAGEAARAMSGA